MDQDQNNISREELHRRARELGRAMLHVGDFYDVVTEFALGYGLEADGVPDGPASPPYTGSRQAGGSHEAIDEPNSAADQATPAPASEHQLRAQIGALNELQSVAWSVIGWRVDDAREQYVPWSRIGEALDMSKQAAQKRFGTAPSRIIDTPPLFSDGE